MVKLTQLTINDGVRLLDNSYIERKGKAIGKPFVLFRLVGHRGPEADFETLLLREFKTRRIKANAYVLGCEFWNADEKVYSTHISIRLSVGIEGGSNLGVADIAVNAVQPYQIERKHSIR